MTELPPLPIPYRARIFDGMATVYTKHDLVSYGAACAAAETEALAAENAALRAANEKMRSDCADAGNALAAIEDENATLRNDAKRYRWLRDVGDVTWMALRRRGHFEGWSKTSDIDDYIDEAMKGKQP